VDVTAVTTTLEKPDPSTPAPVTERAFRTDIEGLRSFAILGVVLFHASVPHFAGGFVGVDVFFVISGFLITGLLLREVQQRGRIHLVGFYARRAKRLLPPAAIVIAATAIAAWFTTPLLTVFTASFDLLWSVFYAANWRFINQGNDYLAGTSDYNVALHFWSLAVEEQFYLVWPALLIAAAWLARRRGWPLRRTVFVTIVVVSAASLAAAVWLTYTDPALAYMATYTRAWQFGVGALLAVAAPAGISARWFYPVGWLGLAAILYSVVAFDGSTPYPGWAALLPTLGTAAVIGSCSSGMRRALSTAVLRTIGRWSYPWYLWHWPVLVLAEAKFGHLDWPVKVALMVAALGLAALTHMFVEAPLMTSAELKRRIPAAAAVGVIATVVGCSTVLTVGTQAVNTLGSGAGATTPASFEEVFGQTTGANSGAVRPAPISARGDIPERPDCLIDRTTEQPDCKFGAVGGRPVVLFGDSHAHQWLTALDELAMRRGWELTVITQSGCPAADIAPRQGETARFSQSYCTSWRNQQIDRIVDMAPATVIVSSLNEYIPQLDEQFEAWSSSLDRLQTSGAELVYIRDTPYPRQNVPECISSALDDWTRCAFPKPEQVDPVVAGVLRGVLPQVEVIDVNGLLCDGDICPAVRNGILLYRDDSHLSDTAVQALTPALEKAFDEKAIR
jgi:peptidoglycan/LPS O-acetylase OafA/YrhL